MPISFELTDQQIDTLADLVAERLSSKTPAPAEKTFINLTEAQKRYGKSYEYFAGRPERGRVGLLNYYRPKLEGSATVLYRDNEHGSYSVNTGLMDAFMAKHGNERF